MKKLIFMGMAMLSLNLSYAQLRVSSTGQVGVRNLNPLEDFQIGDIWTFHNGGTKQIGYNVDYSATFGMPVYIKSDQASAIKFDSDGDIRFVVAPHGSPQSQISWCTPMIIHNSCDVTIPNTLYVGSFQIGGESEASNSNSGIYSSHFMFPVKQVLLDSKKELSPIQFLNAALEVEGNSAGLENIQNLIEEKIDSNDVAHYFLDVPKALGVMVDELASKENDIQKFEDKIEELESRNNELEIKLNELAICLQKVCDELEGSKRLNSHHFILHQNTPNPFKSSTSIKVELNQSFESAELCLFSNSGQKLNCFPLTKLGESIIEVNSPSLESRPSYYTLIVNGEIIDTKQMLKL